MVQKLATRLHHFIATFSQLILSWYLYQPESRQLNFKHGHPDLKIGPQGHLGLIKRQREKEKKRQRGKEAKMQRDKETKIQRDKETKKESFISGGQGSFALLQCFKVPSNDTFLKVPGVDILQSEKNLS